MFSLIFLLTKFHCTCIQFIFDCRSTWATWAWLLKQKFPAVKLCNLASVIVLYCVGLQICANCIWSGLLLALPPELKSCLGRSDELKWRRDWCRARNHCFMLGTHVAYKIYCLAENFLLVNYTANTQMKNSSPLDMNFLQWQDTHTHHQWSSPSNRE